MKTSLTLSISSISVSVIFWGLILLAQASGDGPTAIALGLGWFFIGCPVILTLTIISLVTAFKKPKPVQAAAPVQHVKEAKIVSIVSAVFLVAPVIIGTVIIPLFN